jgi:hypothetical protein
VLTDYPISRARSEMWRIPMPTNTGSRNFLGLLLIRSTLVETNPRRVTTDS